MCATTTDNTPTSNILVIDNMLYFLYMYVPSTYIPYFVELVVDSLDAREEGLARHHLNENTPYTPTVQKDHITVSQSETTLYLV